LPTLHDAVLVQQRRHAVFDYVAETAVTLRRLAPTASLRGLLFHLTKTTLIFKIYFFLHLFFRISKN
jgi:hypothetical protein